MEQHFILKFKDKVDANINIYESTMERVDERNVKLLCKNKTYPGIIVKLPCITESYKTLDSKQYYKICDISTMVVIYPDDKYDFEQERKLYEISGLTPPLKYCKARRFRKKSGKLHIVDEIEQKVNDLLEKDRKATKVEIINDGYREVSDEISNIAAEIENITSVMTQVDNFVEEKNEAEEITENPEISKLKLEIENQQSLIDKALNPILKQRFTLKLEELKRKLEELEENTPKK